MATNTYTIPAAEDFGDDELLARLEALRDSPPRQQEPLTEEQRRVREAERARMRVERERERERLRAQEMNSRVSNGVCTPPPPPVHARIQSHYAAAASLLDEMRGKKTEIENLHQDVVMIRHQMTTATNRFTAREMERAARGLERTIQRETRRCEMLSRKRELYLKKAHALGGREGGGGDDGMSELVGLSEEERTERVALAQAKVESAAVALEQNTRDKERAVAERKLFVAAVLESQRTHGDLVHAVATAEACGDVEGKATAVRALIAGEVAAVELETRASELTARVAGLCEERRELERVVRESEAVLAGKGGGVWDGALRTVDMSGVHLSEVFEANLESVSGVVDVVDEEQELAELERLMM